MRQNFFGSIVNRTTCLQFAILSRQRIPQTPHFGGLPTPAKQTLNRLPIVVTKGKADPIITSPKRDTDLVHFVVPSGR
jgi:hypothetical protein